jgi:hypothetical protein
LKIFHDHPSKSLSVHKFSMAWRDHRFSEIRLVTIESAMNLGLGLGPVALVFPKASPALPGSRGFLSLLATIYEERSFISA